MQVCEGSWPYATRKREGVVYSPVALLVVSPLNGHLYSLSMPRASKMAARAARRAKMVLPNLPRTRKNSTIPYTSSRRTCPYCSKTLGSPADRDRHIFLKPYCRSRHMLAPSAELMQRRKRKREDDDEESDRGERGGPSAGAKPSKLPNGTTASSQPTEPCEADPGSERGSEAEPFIERFPVDTAGQPISTESAPKKDLRSYMDSCGRLRDPELFETAELLMMTVPKAKDRTKHLQSKLVSSSQATG